MSKSNKYNSVAAYWNDTACHQIPAEAVEVFRKKGKLELPKNYIRFDSHHELRVYIQLVRIYGKDRILRQYKVNIADKGYCYPNGRNWRVDFAIVKSQTNHAVVKLYEAKGLFSREFGYIMGMLEAKDRSLFTRLNLVFPSKIPARHNIIKALLATDFKSNITTLQELKKRPILK